jgi:hypothetical protein
VEGVSPNWDIACDFSKELQVEKTGNYIIIGIDNDSYIDEEFKLICSYGNSDSGIFSDDLIIEVGSLL